MENPWPIARRLVPRMGIWRRKAGVDRKPDALNLFLWDPQGGEGLCGGVVRHHPELGGSGGPKAMHGNGVGHHRDQLKGIPEFLRKPGDQVGVAPGSRETEYFKTVQETLTRKSVPGWLDLDIAGLSGRVVSLPGRDEIDSNRIGRAHV